jgi:mannose-6-phosphate isomerase
MNFETYPLQFTPILKERIWGGEKLNTLLHKSISSTTTGESWEITTIDGNESFVANGAWKGQKLTELIQNYPEEILGAAVFERFGNQFPLLFKYIDAKQDLSIQVHPNDILAKKHHNAFGKTEMWYIMQAEEDAKIIIGFKEKTNTTSFLEHLEDKDLVSLLNVKKAKKGDAFLLETGTIHAIGAGVLLAEIQQTSDITYRVYDWDRLDAEGKSRELHLDLALDAMNYESFETQKKYETELNKSNEIVNHRYFTTNFLPIEGQIKIKQNPASFKVYMCIEGAFEIQYKNIVYRYKEGDTILIPANMNDYQLSGKASLLEIYIS